MRSVEYCVEIAESDPEPAAGAPPDVGTELPGVAITGPINVVTVPLGPTIVTVLPLPDASGPTTTTELLLLPITVIVLPMAGTPTEPGVVVDPPPDAAGGELVGEAGGRVFPGVLAAGGELLAGAIVVPADAGELLAGVVVLPVLTAAGGEVPAGVEITAEVEVPAGVEVVGEGLSASTCGGWLILVRPFTVVVVVPVSVVAALVGSTVAVGASQSRASVPFN